MSNGTIEVYEAHPMTLAGRPADILAEAHDAASQLMDVVKNAGLARNLGGTKDHLEFEAWQTLGKFYGLTARCIETRFVQYGNVQGFESVSVLIDRYGQEVSRAEAMCMTDEEKWRSRSKYGYVYVLKDGTKQEAEPPSNQIQWVDNPNRPGKKMPKREKVKIGEEAVPLFQLRSMAQTRSNAKVLRNVLAWVVVLAGFSPTPLEEMTGAEYGRSPTEESNGSNGQAQGNGQEKDIKKPAEKKAEPADDARVKLVQELELFCSGDIDMMNDVCHQISAFGTNNGFAAADIVTQKDDGSYKISDKWIGTALGSLRKMAEAQANEG